MTTSKVLRCVRDFLKPILILIIIGFSSIGKFLNSKIEFLFRFLINFEFKLSICTSVYILLIWVF